jgi:hypothetical protein
MEVGNHQKETMNCLSNQQLGNHVGYAALWREQLGEAWREEAAVFTRPVLADKAPASIAGTATEDRWAVRAAIDAMVAHAYGLTRDQYAHVLSTFSHSSYKDAPRQCLAAFDELAQPFPVRSSPFTAFQQDIPLNEALPQPVIDLPGMANSEQSTASGEAKPVRSPQNEFDFQTAAAPVGSGALFSKQPVTRKQEKGGKS